MSDLADLARRWNRKLQLGRGLRLSSRDLETLVAVGAIDRLRQAVEDEQRINERPEIPAGGDNDALVYFIRSGDHGPIKIGRTRNVKERRHALQLATHCTLTILAAVRAPHWVERYLHQFYEPERIRGEWYRASPRLVAYIESLPA